MTDRAVITSLLVGIITGFLALAIVEASKHLFNPQFAGGRHVTADEKAEYARRERILGLWRIFGGIGGVVIGAVIGGFAASRRRIRTLWLIGALIAPATAIVVGIGGIIIASKIKDMGGGGGQGPHGVGPPKLDREFFMFAISGTIGFLLPWIIGGIMKPTTIDRQVVEP